MSTNIIVLQGNLATDPQSWERDGKMKVNFKLATNRQWGGEEHTEFTPVVVFGKMAPPCAKYLKKGKPVTVTGSIKTRSYEKEGQTYYITEVIADRVDFLGKKDD